MKKVFITMFTIIVLLIVALMVIPVFFKSDILKLIEEQSAKYIRPKLEIGDVSLSMFKSFPDLNVTLKEVKLSESANGQQSDTLMQIPRFEASVNLKSLIVGNEIVINNVLLKDARFMPRIDTTGKANWDIMLPSDTTNSTPVENKATASNAETEQSITFNNIEIQNLYLSYQDIPTSLYIRVPDLNMQLQGNFSESNTLLNIMLGLKDIYFRQGNSVWINNTDFHWQAEIEANLKEMLFNVKKNDMALNDLKLDLTGSLGIKEDQYTMDLKLNAPDTKFESLLALVPKDFQQQIEGVKTSGEFQLRLEAKGVYDEKHFPALDVQFNIVNARLQYPDLPESIEDINLKLNITNPGGSFEQTIANLSTLSFSIANNPLNMQLSVVNPNDPTLQGEAKGTINFESLKKALPLKEMTLGGTLSLDLAFNGKYQYIEKEQYEKFAATGKVALKDVLFKNSDFPDGISIPTGSVTVTPARLNLKDLVMKVNSSDLTLEGNISNYLPYLFKNHVLKGDFTLTSKLINVNEFMAFMSSDTTRTQTTPADTTSMSVVEIPKNIQMSLTTNVNALLFDQLNVKEIQGKIQTTGGVATLKNLSMNMLEGKMVMNGTYNTANLEKPSVDFNLRVEDFDITAAYNAFSFIQQSIPMAMNCSGKISAVMKFASDLDQNMSPIMTTANGGGNLSAKSFLIKDNPALTKLSSLLKNEDLSRISISNLKVEFKLEQGNITVEPFTTNLAGNPTTISGSQTVNGELDYTLSMNINRNYFGQDINNVLSSLPGSDNIKSLDVDVKIEGTLSKPIVKPDLSKAIKTITKESGKKLKENLLKGINNLFKKK